VSILRIEHNKNNPYVILNKKALEDGKLSWAAKGLWAYLMSRPDDWNVSVVHLSKIYEEKGGGEKAIYTLLNELIECGYCERKQPQSDKGKFEKTEYIISEFKKCLPHSLQRDAGERVAVEAPPTNKGIILSKEKEQQHVAVFFDCLEKTEIEQYEKVWLSKNYDEPTVRHAVAYATNPNTKIRTSLIQVIKWACEKKPEISISKEEDAIKNKEGAQKIKDEATIPNGCSFEVLNKHIEICFGGNSISFVLEYSKSGFKEMFREALKKYGIKPK